MLNIYSHSEQGQDSTKSLQSVQCMDWSLAKPACAAIYFLINVFFQLNVSNQRLTYKTFFRFRFIRFFKRFFLKKHL